MNKKLNQIIFVLLMLAAGIAHAQVDTFTVTKTTDFDPFLYQDNPDDTAIVGTLQWAIRKSNDAVNPCLIIFNIPGNGTHTITLTYQLPSLNNEITIDATTQAGYTQGNPAVMINGDSRLLNCFVIYNNNCTIKAVYIQNFKRQGIIVSNVDGFLIEQNTINRIIAPFDQYKPCTIGASGIYLNNSINGIIKGNIIGTDVNLTTGMGIWDYGIMLYASENCLIGGIDAIDANIIAFCKAGINHPSGCMQYRKNKFLNNDKAFANISNRCSELPLSVPVLFDTYTSEGFTSGTAQPGSTIDIFGINENTYNANEYLTSAVADNNGNWSAVVSTQYLFLTGIETDINNCSSILSAAIEQTTAATGTTCTAAIPLPPVTFTCSGTQLQISDTVLWMKFTADTVSMRIAIQNPTDTPAANIQKLILYSGNCGTLHEIARREINAGQLLDITKTDFVFGETYFAKAVQAEAITGWFGACNRMIPQSTEFTPKPVNVCTNLIRNGHFNTDYPVSDWPTTDFQSQYPYREDVLAMDIGTISIDNQVGINGHSWNQYVEGVTINQDPAMLTTDPDYYNFLVCDAAFEIVWTETINVTANANYIFSFWVKNIAISDDWVIPKLKFKINTDIQTFSNLLPPSSLVTVDNSGITVPPNIPEWIQVYGTWNSGTATSAVLNIEIDSWSTSDDEMGCDFGIDDIIFGVMDIPVATVLPSPSTICAGSTANLSVMITGGTGPYTFSWSSNPAGFSSTDANPTVNPSETTVYYCTVVSVSGCTATDDATVTVDFPPDAADFSFEKFDNCEDKPVDFTNLSANAPNCVWYFGDGTSLSSNSSTVQHTYLLPGYYNVTLEASNNCGTKTISKIIEILPSTAQYNKNCCIVDGIFDLSGDYTVDVTQTWPSGEKRIKGTIYINPLCTLTVNTGSSLIFGPQGKVIIHPGGTLIINGGTLTGNFYSNPSIVAITPPCGQSMWKGIEVWGKSSDNFTGQGKLIMSNGATISYAHNAVILGKTQLIPSGSGFIYNAHDPDACGGIIFASNSSFTGNAVNIRFWEYSDNNNSFVNNCTFDGNFIKDPYYNSQNSNANYSYAPIKLHNPFYADANPNQQSAFGIYQYRTFFLKLLNNTFSNMQTGVQIFDSKSFINLCNFNNMKTGISVTNTSSPVNFGNIIRNSTFSNIPGKSINITKGKNDEITGNTIGDNAFPLSSAYGIYLIQSSGFSVKDNTIQRLNRGIFVANSGIGGGVIDNASTGNIVSRCKLGVQTLLNNSNLKIRCNDFENPLIAEYTNSWSINQSFPQQGEFSSIEENKPAGNIFNQGNPSLNKHIQSNNSFWYFSHQAPNFMIPIPQGSTNLNSGSVAFSTYSAACGQSSDGGGGTGNQLARLSGLKEVYSSLVTEYNTVSSNLDHGNTSLLLSKINNTSSGKLQTLLLNNSPLSDEVIFGLLNATSQLPPGNFKNVLIPNSPVSDQVLLSLNNKLANMPPGIAKQIQDAQGYNPVYRTLTSVARDIAVVSQEIQLLQNEIITKWCNNDSITYAIALLEQNNSILATQELLEYYTGIGNAVNAQAKLNLLDAVTDDEQAFIDYYRLLIELLNQGKTIFNMDSTQLDEVRYFASLPDTYPVTWNARAILYLVFGEPVPEFNFQLQSQNNRYIAASDNIETLEKQVNLISVSPNPFSWNTTFYYDIPEDVKLAGINIISPAGKVLQTIEIPVSSTSIEYSTNLPTGLYIYSLLLDNHSVYYGKMTILNK